MKLTELSGIGPKTEEAFKNMGIEDVAGLLTFYPRDFEIFKLPHTISETGYRTFVTLKGAFTEVPFMRSAGGKKIITATFKDEVGASIKVTWFNAPYLRNQIKPGKLYILRGRVGRAGGVLSLNQPKVYEPDDYMSKVGVMQPVYTVGKGVSVSTVVKAVSEALKTGEFYKLTSQDILPDSIRKKYDICTPEFAVKNMHFPKSAEDYSKACARLSFEEIFTFVLTMKMKGEAKKKKTEIVIKPSVKTDEFIKKLPFELTDSQNKVVGEIRRDMSSGCVMNRLLQGDVGSGKTIVALIALLDAAFSGYQGALMAPTEVLARQHTETVNRFLKETGTGLNAALLTGSMTALEKKVVYEALEDGRIDILIGTHALFQEKVIYKNLGLVITDEQHRFGIRQRQALAEKGCEPHMLVMSATPIPRTLALILYGDMDVSSISRAPAGRLPIKNAVVDDSYRENAYRFIEKEVFKGHQAYIICPLIEFSDGVEAANVTDYTQMLKEVLDERISIGVLHGKMSADEKSRIMEKFSEGKIQVLVSTTVVEVGVDVPNATVMMIEDANRFGLAALHQLRGRVGRGKDQSYCILVSNNRSNEAMERLEILNHSNDGFEIAAKDLQMRGPGEFMGTKQSGAFAFRYFDAASDGRIAMEALDAAEGVLTKTIPVSDGEWALITSKTASCGGGIIL